MLRPWTWISDFALTPTIQGGVNAAENTDGDTVSVSAGIYDESVTVDVEGLTLKAADDASPTVDGQGEIPVTVSAANVSVDNENINFQSGIDVGADFSDYEPGLTESDADAVVAANPDGANEYDSIEKALIGENTDDTETSILVKSDYNFSNELDQDRGNLDPEAAAISVLNANVTIISEEGPEETTINAGTDRGVDIEAEGVVIKGFEINAGLEPILIGNIDETADGIEITDNKIRGNNGIVAGANDVANSVSTNGTVIENNQIEVGDTLAISLSDDTNTGIKQNTVTGANSAIQLLDDDGDVTGTHIEANQIENNNAALVLGERSGNNVDVDVVSDNQFINNQIAVYTALGDVEITVDDNWFSTEDEAAVRNQFSEASGTITLNQWAGAPVDPDAGNDGE